MKAYLADPILVELSWDYLIQELWQSVVNENGKLKDHYSLQYFKYELNSDLVWNNDYINQKVQEHGSNFYDSLVEVNQEYQDLNDITIPFDAIYDEQKQSVFVYFLIPSEFSDIFTSEEEYNFTPSEMPANFNLQQDVRAQVDWVLD